MITSVSVVVVPEVGLRVSQAAVSDALQLSIPAPVLVTLKVWVDGFAPPSTPVNVMVGGSEPPVGGGSGSGLGAGAGLGAGVGLGAGFDFNQSLV